MVSCVPGHGPTGRRLTPALLAVTLLTSAVIVGATGADADPENPEAAPALVADAPPPPEDAPPPPEDLPPPPEDAAPPVDDPASPAEPPGEPESGEMLWAAPAGDAPQVLTADVASEQGMQVKTILVARSISAAFPQISSMIGVRPDSQRWHPNGLALDVMIPNSGSSEGVALGDQIVAYALRNVDRFELQDAIWRGTYYTPGGPARGGYGHYDHVHITTFGGGHPSGNEQYLRADEETANQPPPPPEIAPAADDFAPPPPDEAPPPPEDAPPPEEDAPPPGEPPAEGLLPEQRP